MSDANVANITPKPAPLPSTVDDLLAQRKSFAGRTLNDYVEDYHIKLWIKPEYQRVLEAVYDEDAVEGSLAADNLMAAMQIRDLARKENNPHVQGRKLATIVKALNVVMRRYSMSRKERSLTIGGAMLRHGQNNEE